MVFFHAVCFTQMLISKVNEFDLIAVCVCIYTYTHTHTHTYTRTHRHAHTDTHTRTHTHRNRKGGTFVFAVVDACEKLNCSEKRQ